MSGSRRFCLGEGDQFFPKKKLCACVYILVKFYKGESGSMRAEYFLYFNNSRI